jgi:hypothetical protein
VVEERTSIGNQVVVEIRPLGYMPPMKHFSTRDLAILAVSAIVAFSGLYWAFDVELVAAIAVAAGYTVVALVIMYLRSKGSR